MSENSLQRVNTPPSKGRSRRSTVYNDEIAQEICHRLAEGETLISICRDSHMPDVSTVNGWVFDDREGRPTPATGFSAMYARARILHVEYRVDYIEERSRDLRAAQVVKRKEVMDNGRKVVLHEVTTSADIEAAKLEIDTLKWSVGKIAWHLYGNRAPIPVASDPASSEDDTNTIQVRGGLPEGQSSAPPDADPFDLDSEEYPGD